MGVSFHLSKSPTLYLTLCKKVFEVFEMVVLILETNNGSPSKLRGLNNLKNAMAESEYNELKRKLGFTGAAMSDWKRFSSHAPNLRKMTDANLLTILTDHNFSIVSQSGYERHWNNGLSSSSVISYTLMRNF